MSATEIVQTALDLIGVFAFALSGALLAVRRKFDIVGMAVLATPPGGGILRDVLAGQIPSVLRRDSQLYAIPAVAGSLVVAVA
jgi:uncharacterized membrane protein YeiH